MLQHHVTMHTVTHQQLPLFLQACVQLLLQIDSSAQSICVAVACMLRVLHARGRLQLDTSAWMHVIQDPRYENFLKTVDHEEVPIEVLNRLTDNQGRTTLDVATPGLREYLQRGEYFLRR